MSGSNSDSDSETDLSSNSSWTVLDEPCSLNTNDNDRGSEHSKDQLKLTISNNEILTELEIVENDSFCEQSEPPDDKSDIDFPDLQYSSKSEQDVENEEELIHHGCLTFDEYLKERELECEYECQNHKACFDEMLLEGKKSKQGKSKRRKCKAESIGTLTIIGTVLAVAGVSFFCILSPKNYVLTGKEIEKIKSKCNTSDLSTLNDSTVPICSVHSSSNENKLAFIDKSGVLEKCLSKNVTSPRQAKKYLNRNKELKSLKTVNLLEDKPVAEGTESVGPVTYEEYRKQNEKYLETLRSHQNQGIFPDFTQAIEDDSKNALQITEKPLKSLKPTEEFQDILAKTQQKQQPPKTPTTKHIKHPKLNLQSTKICGLENQPKRHDRNVKSSKKTSLHKARKHQSSERHIKNPTECEKNVRSQAKIVCDVLQDIMLLRMTSKVARRMREKGDKSHSKINRKCLRLKKLNPSNTSIADVETPVPRVKRASKSSLVDQKRGYRKREKNSTTLILLDQLPFSKGKKVLRNSRKSEQLNLENKFITTSFPTTKNEEEQSNVPRTHEKCKCLNLIPVSSHQKLQEKLNADITKLRKRQTDFLDKLHKQQVERMEYLRKIRSRQQQSIEALIKDRHMQMCKDVACGNYTVPIPKPADVNQKLCELRHHQPCSSNCCYGFSRCPYDTFLGTSLVERVPEIKCCCSGTTYTCGGRTLNAEPPTKSKELPKNKTICKSTTHLSDSNVASLALKKQKDKINGNTKSNPRIYSNASRDNLQTKGKYYDRIGSYWQKREEYLNRRIDFMNQISDSIKEIMNNYRENKTNPLHNSSASEPVLKQIVNKAVAVFPEDSAIQKLQELSLPKPDHALKKDSKTKLENKEIVPSESKVLPSTSVFQFNASQCKLVCSKSMNIKKESIYNSLFGKQGQHIRKRDVALCYCTNKVSKKKRLNEASKLDLRRLSSSKKAKREF